MTRFHFERPDGIQGDPQNILIHLNEFIPPQGIGGVIPPPPIDLASSALVQTSTLSALVQTGTLSALVSLFPSPVLVQTGTLSAIVNTNTLSGLRSR